MDMKFCTAGNHDVCVANFHKRFGGLQPNCKDCQNTINRDRYRKHAKHHIQAVRVNRRERIDRFAEWKKTLKCSLCPENFIRCLDFHHLDPGGKDFSIAQEVGDISIARMLKELQKCSVLCKNCHVKVHEGIIDGSSLKPLSTEQLTGLT